MAEGLARASMAAVKTNRNDAAIRALRQRLTGEGAQ
jgi:peptidyl-prolyl cis-trans isomerase D